MYGDWFEIDHVTSRSKRYDLALQPSLEGSTYNSRAQFLTNQHTVKPRPEAHMDMILFEVFLKNIHLIPQDQIEQWHYL